MRATSSQKLSTVWILKTRFPSAVAASIGPRLAKDAIVALIDGVPVYLNTADARIGKLLQDECAKVHVLVQAERLVRSRPAEPEEMK